MFNMTMNTYGSTADYQTRQPYRSEKLSASATLVKFFLVICMSASAFADTLKDPGEARKLTDRVMSRVGAGDVEGGLRLMKPYLVIPEAEFEVAVGQMKTQAPSITQRFGKSIGQEFIREDKVGTSLIRIVHIHRFERHPMRWTFFFYQGKDGWVLNTFKFDDDIRTLFPN